MCSELGEKGGVSTVKKNENYLVERKKCIYFALANERKRVCKSSEGCDKQRKIFEKNIAKSFADSKIVLIFATAFASKTARDRIRNQGGKKPYEIKSSLKIFEQLRKFYSLLLKE